MGILGFEVEPIPGLVLPLARPARPMQMMQAATFEDEARRSHELGGDAIQRFMEAEDNTFSGVQAQMADLSLMSKEKLPSKIKASLH